MEFKSGFATIIGRPNVGKSTLLNVLTGEKVAITSPKPQTTRNSIKTILTKEDCQIIFIDTPGIHRPKNKLGEYMMKMVKDTFNEVDIILFLIEATEKEVGTGDLFIIEQLKLLKTPIFLIVNKIDKVKKEILLPLIDKYKDLINFQSIIPVSALNKEGIDIVINEINKVLPIGPKYFPDDMLTDQPERVIVAEIIREKMLNLLNEEVPHGIGVEVILFKEREQKKIIDIETNIYCEKDSHKKIIIGKGGKMLKKIGSLARVEIENLLASKINLQLWVKVKKDWRNNDYLLKTLGYKE